MLGMVVTPVISKLGRLRQKGHEFEASLGYLSRPCLRKGKKKKKPWSRVTHNLTGIESNLMLPAGVLKWMVPSLQWLNLPCLTL
jgi:hypothetical protein